MEKAKKGKEMSLRHAEMRERAAEAARVRMEREREQAKGGRDRMEREANIRKQVFGL